MFFLARIDTVSTCRALVTGGTGFIGSHLIDELLEQGYDVRVLRRNTSNITLLENKKLSFVVGDLTDTESLVRACQQVDVVFHLAALPRDWGPKKTFFEVNFDGTKHLLDACVQQQGIALCIYELRSSIWVSKNTTTPDRGVSEKSHCEIR